MMYDTPTEILKCCLCTCLQEKGLSDLEKLNVLQILVAWLLIVTQSTDLHLMLIVMMFCVAYDEIIILLFLFGCKYELAAKSLNSSF